MHHHFPFGIKDLKKLIPKTINMKLQQMKNRRYFITLPNQIIRAKGWEKGEDIKIEIDQKGNLVLKR